MLGYNQVTPNQKRSCRALPLKCMSKLWAHEFPMNCSISFSIGMVKMAYHTFVNICRDFPLQRLPFDITISKNIIPFPFVDLDKNTSEWLFIRSDSIFGFDARVSPMLDIIACGPPNACMTHLFHDFLEKLSKLMPRFLHVAVWAFGCDNPGFRSVS